MNQQKLTKSEVTRPSSTSQPKKQQTVRRSRQKQVKASERSANISDIQVETDQFQSDASTSESRIMEIVHPSSIPYEPVRGRTVKNLPFSVQKAISHALKQDYNIPYLDTIKYYLKDPAVRIPNSKLSSLDSHLKPWWQTSSNVKINSESTSFTLSPQRLLPINTTPKPLISTSSISPPAPFPSSEYVTYPLLRGYPIHYSPMNSPLNDASGNNNGISFLYGDRIYSKIPYNLGTKSSVSSNLNDVISNVEPITEIQSSTPNSLTSTSPIVFPPMVKTTISSPTKIPEKSYVHYYSAEESVKDAQNGVLLSNDKNTLNLITKAVNAIKKHNPHLDVVPKRIENDELIVHVTPKPEYFITPTERVKSTLALDGDKNHAYLTNGPVLSKQKTAKVVNHHYLKQIHVPAHHDDLVSIIYFIFIFYFLLYVWKFCCCWRCLRKCMVMISMYLCRSLNFNKQFFPVFFFHFFQSTSKLVMLLVIVYEIIQLAMTLATSKNEWLTEQRMANTRF